MCLHLHYRWSRLISSFGLNWESQGSCTLSLLSGSSRGIGRENSLLGFPQFGLNLEGGGRMEVLFFGWGGIFPRLEQALGPQDSSCVLHGENYKLCSGLGNGRCVITGECSQMAPCFR